MKKTQLLGVIRHILTFGGGYVAAKGFLPEPIIDEVIGALITLIGVAWSVAAPEKTN